jgi:hypothetical protein
MRSDLRYADLYREQARAADGLHNILDCEYPGTVSEVKVRKGRWFRRNPSSERPEEEIILDDDQRREFSAWCRERAAKLKKQADEIEARYAEPKEPAQ